MATIIRSVQNLTTGTITLPLGNVVLLPSVTVDLYTVVSDDVLLALQAELQGMVARQSIALILSDERAELLAGGSERDLVGNLNVQGTLSAAGAFIVPKLTSVQIAALVAVAGMVVYDTTTNHHQGYDGSAWQDLY